MSAKESFFQGAGKIDRVQSDLMCNTTMDHRSIVAFGSGSTDNFLSLTDVYYCLDGKAILEGLTLEMKASRIGVVGRNGSGKTTLGRLLAGLISPSSGELRVNHKNLAKDRKSALTNVGMLFQNPDHQIIFPTVEEEIAFGLVQQGHSHRSARQLTEETLLTFGKLHWSDAPISSLSQGQKHLLCMMSIIAMKPKLIILDEPFTGLDIPTKAQLNRYLKHFKGGLVHITHDPSDLEEYDKLIWLENGKLAAAGDARALLRECASKMNEMGGMDDISDLSH